MNRAGKSWTREDFGGKPKEKGKGKSGRKNLGGNLENPEEKSGGQIRRIRKMLKTGSGYGMMELVKKI